MQQCGYAHLQLNNYYHVGVLQLYGHHKSKSAPLYYRKEIMLACPLFPTSKKHIQVVPTKDRHNTDKIKPSMAHSVHLLHDVSNSNATKRLLNLWDNKKSNLFVSGVTFSQPNYKCSKDLTSPYLQNTQQVLSIPTTSSTSKLPWYL